MSDLFYGETKNKGSFKQQLIVVRIAGPRFRSAALRLVSFVAPTMAGVLTVRGNVHRYLL